MFYLHFRLHFDDFLFKQKPRQTIYNMHSKFNIIMIVLIIFRLFCNQTEFRWVQKRKENYQYEKMFNLKGNENAFLCAVSSNATKKSSKKTSEKTSRCNLSKLTQGSKKRTFVQSARIATTSLNAEGNFPSMKNYRKGKYSCGYFDEDGELQSWKNSQWLSERPACLST